MRMPTPVISLAATVSTVLVAGLVTAVTPAAVSAAERAEPTGLSVTGDGTTLYPAFDPDIRRYGLRTTARTDGRVTVAVDTSGLDEAVVTVAGRPLVDGEVELEGVRDGQEIGVLVTDPTGTTAYTVVYLPDGFPEINATISGAGPASGGTFLSTTNFFGGPRFETIVDAHGVPLQLTEVVNGMDYKRQPNGNYSVARASSTSLYASYVVVELDEQFRQVGGHETVGLGTTDFHDSILLPDGTVYVMAYVPNDETQMTDSVVQHLAADGTVLFEWNSEDHVDPELDGLTPLKDYAHLNSVELMADGDLLMSFRHTSQVLKVARTAHDGFAEGDVVWRLGGRRSDFTFPGDPYEGPCAQHTARELADGTILLFDNGSQVTPTTLTPMCADPDGPGETERPQSRVVAYDLDEAAGTATIDWSWQRDGLFAEFAGSSQRLPGGHTLAGLAAATPDVVEVDADGNEVWELDLPASFSYRAAKHDVPDAIAPTIDLAVPADGAVYAEGEAATVTLSCSDAGGAGLASCDPDVAHGTPLDTTPGTHTIEVVATDAAGHETTVAHTYTVVPSWRPDAMIRTGGEPWRGDDRYGSAKGQRVAADLGRTGAKQRLKVRVVNDGSKAARFVLDGTGGTKSFKVVWRHGGAAVTGAVVDGSWRTPRLRPDESTTLTLVVKRLGRAEDGDRRKIRLTASARKGGTPDTVLARVRAR